MRLRILIVIGVLVGHMSALLVPAAGRAMTANVIISGLQTASIAKASDEFVELSNPTTSSIELTGWQLQYRPASSGQDCTKGWIIKATITAGMIPAGGHYLLSSTSYLSGATSFATGLASAGTVRLLDGAKLPADALAWGAASCGTGQPAAAPLAGQSLERYSGSGGLHGDNSLDYFIQTVPLVHSAVTSTNPTPMPASAPTPTLEPVSLAGPKLRLSELLIDPIAPQTDAHDEFVELQNIGTDPLDVGGYAVQVGTHTFTLPAGTLGPDEYLVVTSADSPLSLANAGGVANLLDPAGVVIDTAGAWGQATPGAAWAFTDDTWRWTSTPTPGAANVSTLLASQASGLSAEYTTIELSELLPDPAAPLTDANDEFIELFNPNDQPVNVDGYVLKTGHDLSGKYVIKNVTIPAGGYAALKSLVTKLALSNVGSSVGLYAPDGVQLGATVIYPKAGAGNAWARLNGNWDWTTEPTPGSGNIISPVIVPTAAAKAATKSTKAKGAVKAAATKKQAAAKTKATKAPSKPLLAGATSTGGRWLLFILAGLTLAYIIYEFRYDLRNYYYKLRGNAGDRPAFVPVPVRRGSDRADQRSGRR